MITTISHNLLTTILKEKISLPDLETALSDMGMELKHVDGDSLDVEITPDRLDLLGAVGLGRALRSFLEKGPQPSYTVLSSDYQVILSDKLKGVREHTRCVVIKDIALTQHALEELIVLQEKLHATLARGRLRGAIGVYPLDKIHFPITFTADDPQNISFTPLGEDKKMTATQILQEHETGKTYAHLLADKKKYPYFIDSKKNILSLPPLINSESVGKVTTQTTDLFIECSGDEEHVLEELLVYISTVCLELGATLHEVTCVYSDGRSVVSPRLENKQQCFSLSLLKERIGISPTREDIEKLLNKMMYGVKHKPSQEVLPTKSHSSHVPDEEDNHWILSYPVFRFDVWHEVDVVDDIARAYGYNNIELTQPDIVSFGGQLPLTKLREQLTQVAIGLGFLENYTFALTDIDEQRTKMLLDANANDFIPVANGLQSQGMLRTSLLPQQLQTLSHNKNRPLAQKLCEGAFVVLPDETKDVRSKNELHFTAVLSDTTTTFTQIKQVLDTLLESRGYSCTVKPTNHPSYIKGRCATILIHDKPVGLIGEVHPQVLENFGLTAPVASFELNIEVLQ
ncbi:MAG: phenylalanine--tRNA ligase subunit beta [Candidatus Nanoarchaeia archaeon]